MGDENNNIDLVNLAIAGVAATNPLLAFILMIGWHIQLFHVIPEKLGYCRGLIQKLTKRAEEKKDGSWKSKVAFGILKPIKVATGVLPEPPKNKEDVEHILKLCNENNDCINEELDKFLHGKYIPSEFIERIKNVLGAKTSVEALDLYINLKEMILDQKMFQEFDKIAALGMETKKDLEAKIEEISTNFEKNLKNLGTKILTLDEGFKIITPVYFYFYKRDKSKGIDDWKRWGLRLEDMQTELDYRRKIVDEIKKVGNFLIIGESGYSKSTTLYRIIYDYCEKYYTVIASLGNDKIENPQKIVKVIEDLLNEGNVLVAIDNIQDENKIKAFEIIYALATHKDFERIKFVFTSRLSDFEDIISYKKYIPKDTREAIDYSLENLMKRKQIGKFDLEEAEGFVRKFYPLLYGKEVEEELLKKILPEHFKFSNNGNPLLFKYWLTGNGIEKDVKDKYLDYIVDKYTEKEKETRLNAVLFSCILNLCGIKITDGLASKCKVDLKLLKNRILKYDEPTGTWEMMHHVWDIQFLMFWDSESRKEEKNPNEIVKQIVDTILDLKDAETAYKLISGLANIIVISNNKKELFGLFESSITVPVYIDVAKAARLYTSLGYMRLKLEDFYWSLGETTTALMLFEGLAEANDEFKNELAVAYNNRGVAHFYLEDYFEAIQDYNKAIEINPKDENIYVVNGGQKFPIFGGIKFPS